LASQGQPLPSRTVATSSEPPSLPANADALASPKRHVLPKDLPAGCVGRAAMCCRPRPCGSTKVRTGAARSAALIGRSPWCAFQASNSSTMRRRLGFDRGRTNSVPGQCQLHDVAFRSFGVSLDRTAGSYSSAGPDPNCRAQQHGLHRRHRERRHRFRGLPTLVYRSAASKIGPNGAATRSSHWAAAIPSSASIASRPTIPGQSLVQFMAVTACGESARPDTEGDGADRLGCGPDN
jgi:hypothetical protein